MATSRIGSVIGTEMRSELRQIWDDQSLLVMLLLLPLLYALTVAYLYGSESVVDAPIVVVDEDGSRYSNRLTWMMDATEEVRVVERIGSVEEAFAWLRRHDASAVVMLPKGFEQHLLAKEPARIKLWIDSANMLTYGTAYTGIRAAITELDNELGRQAFVAKGIGSRQAAQRTSSIELSERLLFHPTGSYGGFMAPAVFIMALQQAILLAFAVSVGGRRERSGSSPLREAHAYSRLVARYLVHLPFHLLSSAIIASLVTYWYRFPVAETGRTFALLAGFTIATGPLAVIVSLCFRNDRAPLQVLMLVSTPLFLASGYTWPLALMPEPIQFLAQLVPSTPTLAGLRTVVITAGSSSALWSALNALARLFALYTVVGLVLVTVASWLGRHRVQHQAVAGTSRG
ncbi:MAG: ABC transporter permease [Myxococcales bacterium]